ncbi:MAG: hypothetical protein CBB71_06795 [Rhodopirellula sp. TMED11]|nr:MAG: hypothetical protein CBB71_06795 [Rhodopirellula sp. TMED11]
MAAAADGKLRTARCGRQAADGTLQNRERNGRSTSTTGCCLSQVAGGQAPGWRVAGGQTLVWRVAGDVILWQDRWIGA